MKRIFCWTIVLGFSLAAMVFLTLCCFLKWATTPLWKKTGSFVQWVIEGAQ